MHKYYVLAIASLILIGCRGRQKEEQLPTETVQFNISTFEQTAQRMNMPAAVILDDEDGQPITDLYVFDETTQVAHQTSNMDDFGTLQLSLTHGHHSLSFILTRSTGISVQEGVMTFSSVRSTFGTIVDVNVTKGIGVQKLTLGRISGQMQITINDAFPTDAAEIEFVINPRYTQLDVTNLQAVNGASVATKVACTSKAGQSEVVYTFNHICPSLLTDTQAEVTINVYNASGTIIYTVTIPDVRLASYTKTFLGGNLFETPSLTIKTQTSWHESISQSW